MAGSLFTAIYRRLRVNKHTANSDGAQIVQPLVGSVMQLREQVTTTILPVQS